jgi:uncharacterized membrane protein YbaN (DUF454 family)
MLWPYFRLSALTLAMIGDVLSLLSTVPLLLLTAFCSDGRLTDYIQNCLITLRFAH